MWDKSQKMPNLCSKIAPASPGVSDKKSPAPGGLGASITRPRPEVGAGAPGHPGAYPPGLETLGVSHFHVCTSPYLFRYLQEYLFERGNICFADIVEVLCVHRSGCHNLKLPSWHVLLSQILSMVELGIDSDAYKHKKIFDREIHLNFTRSLMSEYRI